MFIELRQLRNYRLLRRLLPFAAALACCTSCSSVQDMKWPVESKELRLSLDGALQIVPGKNDILYLRDGVSVRRLKGKSFDVTASFRIPKRSTSVFTTDAVYDPRLNKLLLTAYPTKVFVLNPDDLSLEKEISVDKGASGLAIARSGMAFVACSDSGTLALVDLSRGRQVRSVPVGKAPYALAAEEDGTSIYVGYNGESFISRIDAKSLKDVRHYQLYDPKKVDSLGVPLVIGITSLLRSGPYLYAGGRADYTIYRVTLESGKVDRLTLPSGCYSLAAANGFVFPGTQENTAATCYTTVVDGKSMKVYGRVMWSPLTGTDYPSTACLTTSRDGSWLYTAAWSGTDRKLWMTRYRLLASPKSRASDR